MKKISFFWIAFLILSLKLSVGQPVTIILSFYAQNEQVPVELDSVLIENLSKGTDTMLYKPTTSILIYNSASDIDEEFLSDKNFFMVSDNYPNPFSGRSDFRILISESQTIEILITNVSGRCLTTYSDYLVTGNHTFSFYPGKESIYFCLIRGKHNSKGIKMICSGNTENNICKIIYDGYDLEPDKIKSGSRDDNFQFMPGDQLRYTGFAMTLNEISGSEVLEDSPVVSSSYTFNVKAGIPCREIPVFEYEGQTYHTVKIGQQCWMQENLNVGKKIWAGLNQEDNDTIEKYCYNNDPVLCDIYGGLYQWGEMMNYKEEQQTQGICPEGWHIPSKSDWDILNSSTGGSQTAGVHLKEAGNEHWIYYFDTYSDNSSGFTGLPGGHRIHSQYFELIGEFGAIWSSTMSDYPYSMMEGLTYENSGIGPWTGTRSSGYSVRCLLNSNNLPVVLTSSVHNISDSSAFSGGVVTDEGSAPVIARGICWSTDNLPSIADSHSSDGTGPGSYSSFLQFLQPGITYHYSAYATNQYGTSYGIVDDFTTLVVEPPQVVTWPAREITDTSAVGVGYLHDDGNGIILERGICWSTNQNPTIDDQHTHDTTTTVIYYNEITGLSPNTTYYFRAYARNKAGLDYSFDDSPLVTKNGIDYTIPCPEIPTITYENQIYHTVQIGDQCWLKENLNAGTKVSGDINSSDNGVIEKYCYDDDIGSCNRYGGLYRWDEAMNYQTQEESKGICPEGWHIPSNNDWNALSEFVGGNSVAGGALKETGTNNWLFPNAGSTDIVGFSAIPGGFRLPYYDFEYGWYMSSGEKSFFWTSSFSSQSESLFDWEIQYNSMAIESSTFNSFNFGFSVRCIKD